MERASYGFRVWSGRPQVMHDAHQHADVELNFLPVGSMRYFIRGRQQLVPSRRLAMFWGGVPHTLVAMEPETECSWTTVPISALLAWRLPQHLVAALLRGDLLLEPESDRAALDEAQQREWASLCAMDEHESSRIVWLEVEARIRRFALLFGSTRPVSYTSPPTTEAAQLAERVAELIAARFAERLTIANIAMMVDARPQQLMRAFKKCCGMSVGDYLTGVRVSQAQRLLIETDFKILDVALRSGFGSTSRFYEAFMTAVGQTPTAYREELSSHTRS